MTSRLNEITALLHEAAAGSPAAIDRLLPIVYDELRRMAGARLQNERPDHTLSPTALVHEAYLRLAQGQITFEGRHHFFAVAARAMRHILVDHARRRKAGKRGGQYRVTLDPEVADPGPTDPDEVLDVDRALDRLATIDPRQAELVELRYFVGLSIEETATAQGTSPATVKRDWLLARAWLARELATLR